eukprot:7383054-Prymnesium_polylepis.2
MATTCRTALSGSARVLKEASATVATEVGDRISVLAAHARNFEDLFDPLIEGLHVGSDDLP